MMLHGLCAASRVSHVSSWQLKGQRKRIGSNNTVNTQPVSVAVGIDGLSALVPGTIINNQIKTRTVWRQMASSGGKKSSLCVSSMVMHGLFIQRCCHPACMLRRRHAAERTYCSRMYLHGFHSRASLRNATHAWRRRI